MNTTSESAAPVVPAVGLLASGVAELEALGPCAGLLERFNVGIEKAVVTPENGKFAGGERIVREAAGRGIRVLIVACEDTALPAALAEGVLPVIRLPMAAPGGEGGLSLLIGGSVLEGFADAPGGAFATVAIGEAGARNAALLAISILALTDHRLRDAWRAFREEQTAAVLAQPPLA